MTYKRFITFNVIAGISWISIMTLAGYFFGDLPFVKNNFPVVVLTIIFISVLPGIISYLRQRRQVF